jgi:hypothetical protein
VAYLKKIVLNCPKGHRLRLDDLVKEFIRDGVIFVGVVGKDCAKIEDLIDELVVGDGSRDYDLLTSSHPNESIDEAVSFAKSLTGEHAGDVQIVEL